MRRLDSGATNRPNIGIELKTKTETYYFGSRLKTDYTDKCKLADFGVNELGLMKVYDPQQGGPPTII